MSTETKGKIESWNKSYGTLTTFLWRAVFYPILCLILYSTSAYLEKNYTTLKHFDESMRTLAGDKAAYNTQTQFVLKEISGKIDAVLIQQATATAKREELERRIIRLENFSDGKRSVSLSLSQGYSAR